MYYALTTLFMLAIETGLESSMGFFGLSAGHTDDGDDEAGLTCMISNSRIPDDYEPGRFHLFGLGMYIIVRQSWETWQNTAYCTFWCCGLTGCHSFDDCILQSKGCSLPWRNVYAISFVAKWNPIVTRTRSYKSLVQYYIPFPWFLN